MNFQVLAFRIKSYLKWRWEAKNRHGIHSPFVYKLNDEVINYKKSNSDYLKIEKLRRELLEDKRLLNIKDFGAGSQFGNVKQKTVAQLARQAAKRPKYAQLLYRLAMHFKPENMLELGTSLGISAAYQAMPQVHQNFYSLEGDSEIAAIAKQNLHKLGLQKVKIEPGKFEDTLSTVLAKYAKLDWAFIDGNHTEKGTLQLFAQLLPYVHNQSILIFDDVHWSPGMEQAWECIKKHPQVSLTIDLYEIGLVFFRKEQVKEHFCIWF